MLQNLTDSQKWVLVAFIAAALTAATTFFLQGDVQIFAYMLIGLGVAAYAVLSSRDEKEKRSE